MEINALKDRSNLDPKIQNAYAQFSQLLEELRKRELPAELLRSINQGVEQINAVSDNGKELKKQIRKTQMSLIKKLEKELKLVPINHYRNTWMVLGMTTFGVPMGVAFGVAIDNYAFIGFGIPIGMVIGIALGAGMDKKAEKEGRQLAVEFKV